MSWQTIAYFSSIVLTFLLTGLLAWYTWRQGSLPVARPYAWLALSECLLALTDILSMLSSNVALRQFWFNMRYLFAATIPVFFIIFAMEYTARTGWQSKPLLLVLFALPFLTQVMVWTNNLHHLWVTQEVGFFQDGIFWLNDPSLRVPGLWFLVHNFSSQLLMLAGIVILLAGAWRKRKTYLGQGLLLSAGALVGIVAALIPAFNLAPDARYNIFVPGIGLSAVLYAFAILGNNCLKHFPGKGAPSSTSALEKQGKQSLALFLLIFLLVVSGFVSAGYFSYQGFQREYRTQSEAQLLSIASLKVDELERWYHERLGDGEVFQKNPAFSALVQHYLDDPSDPQWKGQLQSWLDTTGEIYNYHRLLLLDSRGTARIAFPAGQTTVPEHIIEEMPSILQSGQVTFQDFHRHSNGSLYLGFLVPIFAEQDATTALGMLVMEIDPAVYIYPYLNRWPAPSQTGETLLVRGEGEEVLFLNPLRFAPDAALNLRFPLTDTDILAVKAVLGETGIVEGMDYRGEQVIGAVSPVPGTPWFIVSRMDKAEVIAPLRARLWQTLLTFGAFILASGAGLGLVWRQQRIRQYREHLEMVEALQESEEKFRQAFLISPDAIAITRLADGKFVLVNHGFEQILGYTEQEVLGKSSLGLDIWVNPADRERIVAELQAAGRVVNFEAQFRSKRGEIRHGLMSAAVIELNGETHILNTTRDITERKQADEKLIVSEMRYRRLFEAARDGILILDAETGVIVDANPFLSEVLGSTKEEICGKKIWNLGFFKDIVSNKANFLELQQKEYIRYEDLPLETTDGRRIDVEFVSNVYQVNHHKVIQCNIRDITARKRAEDMLHKRLELLEYGSSHSLEEVLVKTLDETSELTGSPIGFYHFVDADQENLSLQAWSTRTTQEYCQAEGEGMHYPIYRAGIWADCVKTRSPIVHNDYASEPGRKGLPEGHAALIRELVVPILRGGKVVAILGVGNKATKYTRGDVELVTYFADIGWESAERKQAEEIQKSYSARLETEVEKRSQELREAQEKMVRQERLATLGEVAASIGHELRNPLGVITNAIYYLKMSQPEANESIQEYLNIIEAETRNSEKIISDLLDFTRSKAVERAPVAVPGLIQHTLERYPAPETVEVSLKLPADLPKILADSAQASQILGNLVVNAFQTMPRGGSLTISAESNGDMVGIAVSDTGEGISLENINKLFEPLFTTKARGIGLGLAVCKKLVEAHGGRIEVASEPGKGSTFTVYFPSEKEKA